MATVTTRTSKPKYVITLTEKEALGLLQLLDYGVVRATIEKLSLDSLTHSLAGELTADKAHFAAYARLENQ